MSGRRKLFTSIVWSLRQPKDFKVGKTFIIWWKGCSHKFVLHALPVHLLSVVHPPNTTLEQIEKLISDFFWGMDGDRKKKHWCAWSDLCFPINEGGAGFRSLHDFYNTFSATLWWKLRTHKPLLFLGG